MCLDALFEDFRSQSPFNCVLSARPCTSPLCNMAFTSEAKRDQHMKFSPAHASSPADSTPEQIPVKATSKTIYSGTKLFWRSGLNVEFFIQQHEEVDAVQVRPPFSPVHTQSRDVQGNLLTLSHLYLLLDTHTTPLRRPDLPEFCWWV